MARLDVSEILGDPDFTDAVTLTRRAVTVDDNGETVITPTLIRLRMVVQGTSAKDLERLPEGLRLHGAVTVWSARELFAESPNGYPDLISFRGKNYQVSMIIGDFMNYGKGYSQALCTMVEVSNAQ